MHYSLSFRYALAASCCWLILSLAWHAHKLGDPPIAQPPISVPDGFDVACVYRVPESQGSWVVIADAGPRGLVTSDQYGKLYEVALPDDASPQVSVQPLDVGSRQRSRAAVAFDSLYIMVNEGTQSGLYRSRTPTETVAGTRPSSCCDSG